MVPRSLSRCALALFFFALSSPALALASSQSEKQNSSSKASPKQPSPDEQLQQAISSSGTDRAALVRNLEGYLKEYPDSRQRAQIYRALVEACMQLRDDARAASYAERIVALSPDDISMTILAMQLLERTGDDTALRRATSYATRVLDFVDRNASTEKSPKISQEEWALEKKRDRMSALALRGRLELKLHDVAAAQQDFEASYAVLPGATSAEQLGEIAERKKDLNAAIQQYARAFALAEASAGPASRKEIRQKLGNVWRLSHGTEIGLGEYLLLTFDEVGQSSLVSKPKKNADAREPADFVLRKAPDGAAYPLRDLKGKVFVVNFWATWCGPCHELEPMFARVAADFQANPDVFFMAANCDEDESLARSYLEANRPRTHAFFADGLDRFFAVNAFPTVVVIDRGGKIAFRADGFNPDSFEPDLTAAVRRALSQTSASTPPPTPTP